VFFPHFSSIRGFGISLFLYPLLTGARAECQSPPPPPPTPHPPPPPPCPQGSRFLWGSWVWAVFLFSPCVGLGGPPPSPDVFAPPCSPESPLFVRAGQQLNFALGIATLNFPFLGQSLRGISGCCPNGSLRPFQARHFPPRWGTCGHPPPSLTTTLFACCLLPPEILSATFRRLVSIWTCNSCLLSFLLHPLSFSLNHPLLPRGVCTHSNSLSSVGVFLSGFVPPPHCSL